MARLTFVQPDGVRKDVEVTPGVNLMHANTQAGVARIEAEYGGNCSCAACHVYVDAAVLDRLLPPDALVEELLSGTSAERRVTSPRCCQIRVSEALGGAVFHVPDRQF